MYNIGLYAIVVWSLFLIVMVFVDYKKDKKTESFKDFVLAKNIFNNWQIALSLIASYIGGGTLIAFAGQVAKIGFAFFFIPIGVCIAFLVFGLVSKHYRKANISINETAKTAIQRLLQSYGEDLFWPIFIIMCLSLLSFISIQLYGGALLLHEILNINEVIAAAIIACVTGVYSKIGGTRGDVITDIFQGIVILLVIFTSLFLLYNGNPIVELTNNLNALNKNELLNPINQGWGFAIAMVILPFFAIHTDPSLHLRLYAAKSDKAAKSASIIASFIYFVFGASLILVILGIFSLGLGDGDNILIDYAINKSNKIIGIGFTIAIYSAVISTLDSQSIKLSSIIVNDLFGKVDNKINGNSDHQGKMVKLILPWIFVLGFSFSLILFAFQSAFLFLSSVWVFGIASFGLLFMGLWWPQLRLALCYNEILLKWEIIGSSLAILVAIVYLLLAKDPNPSSKLLVLGTLIVVIKLFYYILVSFYMKLNKIVPDDQLS